MKFVPLLLTLFNMLESFLVYKNKILPTNYNFFDSLQCYLYTKIHCKKQLIYIQKTTSLSSYLYAKNNFFVWLFIYKKQLLSVAFYIQKTTSLCSFRPPSFGKYAKQSPLSLYTSCSSLHGTQLHAKSVCALERRASFPPHFFSFLRSPIEQLRGAFHAVQTKQDKLTNRAVPTKKADDPAALTKLNFVLQHFLDSASGPLNRPPSRPFATSSDSFGIPESKLPLFVQYFVKEMTKEMVRKMELLPKFNEPVPSPALFWKICETIECVETNSSPLLLNGLPCEIELFRIDGRQYISRIPLRPRPLKRPRSRCNLATNSDIVSIAVRQIPVICTVFSQNKFEKKPVGKSLFYPNFDSEILVVCTLCPSSVDFRPHKETLREIN